MSKPEDNKFKKMVEEVKLLQNWKFVFDCLHEVFEVVIGIGSCRFATPCFNYDRNTKISNELRETSISSEISMDKSAIMKATCCYHFHGCPKCRALCCLSELSALPKEENALSNKKLCEKVFDCVIEGAGIFNLSLLFALLRTSPDFREDSLILYALVNSVKEDKWGEAVEIANMFFKAKNKLKIDDLLYETPISAKRFTNRYIELRTIEKQLCETKYAEEIGLIRKEQEEAAAAALEAKKKMMPECKICHGDKINYPPIYSPQTCGCKICCRRCENEVEDSGKKLNNICPLCNKPFTDDQIWAYFFDRGDD